MYTTGMPLIYPGDYWIFFVSLLIFSLFVVQKFRLFAYLALGVTTTIIYMHYGTARAILHLLIMFLLVLILRLVTRKLARQEIVDDK